MQDLNVHSIRNTQLAAYLPALWMHLVVGSFHFMTAPCHKRDKE